jgi:protein-S-isoprenylcysteine O-methyltransferase Ste14
MRRYSAGTIGMAADQKVISIGPYALIRHPMYSGVRRLKFKSAVGRDYTATE